MSAALASFDDDPTQSALGYYGEVIRPPEPSAPQWRQDGRFRLEVADKAGQGRVEGVHFASGMMLMTSDHQLNKTLVNSFVPSRTAFGFGILLNGFFDLSLPHSHSCHTITPDRVWLRSHSLEMPLTAKTPGNTRMRGVEIHIEDHMMDSWRNEAPSQIASAISRILANGAPPFLPFLALDTEMRDLINGILASDMRTVCGRLRAESNALALLAKILAPDVSLDETTSAYLGRRERAVLDDAVGILEAEWADPPTISLLARRIGTNECYLKADFRKRFGMTIGTFVRIKRMNEARRLIEQEGYNVQEAATEVGFSNPSQFSAAFRRIHGVNPSAIRPHGGRQ